MQSTQHISTFVGAMAIAAAASTSYAGISNHTVHPAHAVAVLALAAVTSRMKVKLPGIDGNMSVNLPFLLVAAVSLSAAEAIAIAGVSTVVQCWPKTEGSFKAQQMLFNVSMVGLATFLASLVFHAKSLAANAPLALVLAGATLFLGQTLPVASIVALSDGSSLRNNWLNLAQMSFPYYVVSAGVTSMMQAISHNMGWQAALAVFPVMYVIHLSHRLYFSRVVEAPQPVRVLVRAAGAGA